MSQFVTRVLVETSLATVTAFAHGEGWRGDPEEESFGRPSAILTVHDRWRLRGSRGAVEADHRVVVLGHPGERYCCSHESARPTDRTVDVSVDHERLGYDPLPSKSSVLRTARVEAVVQRLLRAESRLDADALVLALLLELRGEPVRRPRSRPSAVAAARDRLDASVEQGVTLLELAQSVHVSPYHLHRLFRAEVGVSPHEYLTRLRIRRARDLLAAGASVGEAASATGFGSPGYFAAVFKRRAGVSPSAYRLGLAGAAPEEERGPADEHRKAE
jgi:AraC-like DNA-binding protein